MKRYLSLIMLVLLVFLVSSDVFANEKSDIDGEIKSFINEYRTDLNNSQVTGVNPMLGKYIGESNFKNEVEEKNGMKLERQKYFGQKVMYSNKMYLEVHIHRLRAIQVIDIMIL